MYSGASGRRRDVTTFSASDVQYSPKFGIGHESMGGLLWGSMSSIFDSWLAVPRLQGLGSAVSCTRDLYDVTVNSCWQMSTISDLRQMEERPEAETWAQFHGSREP